MTRVSILPLLFAAALAGALPAQAQFVFEDLDPDETSLVGNGLTITGGSAGGRAGVGIANLGSATNAFTSLLAPNPIDLTGLVGPGADQTNAFNAAAEVFIPSTSPLNTGDSIYLTVDFFNATQGITGPDDRVRINNGFFGPGASKDTWLGLNISEAIPDIPEMTTSGFTIDSANVSVILTDGGFGGVPNDSGTGDFAYLDNFSVTVGPPPVNMDPVFFNTDAPSDANMGVGNILFEAAVDPNDASNDVGEVLFGGTAPFVNVNIGEPVDVSFFEGERFRASFDYLVPADTAMTTGTLWGQVAFNDPASASAPQGAGNSTSVGFPPIGDVADGVWRTIEITGEIPPDSDGAAFQIVASDPGQTTFGTGFLVDNVVFESFDTIEGDFNDDGVVDIADYTTWRDNLGAAAPAGPPFEYRDAVQLSGERSIAFSGDGANGVTTDDYTVWVNGFSGPSAEGAAIPEPSSLLGGLGVLVVAVTQNQRERRRS